MSKIAILSTRSLGHHITEEELLISELRNRGHQVSLKYWEELVDDQEDLFLVRTTWNYTEHLSDFLEKLKPIEKRLLNPLELIKWNSNKKYLLELQAKGHDVMPLELASDLKELDVAIDKLGGDEFIIKPLIGASAQGLIRFNKKNKPILAKEVIVQRFYAQILEGEISLFFFNRDFKYAVKKIPKVGDIRVQEEYGSQILAYEPNSEEFAIAQKVILEIPSNWLYARVDIVPKVGLIELECIEPSLYYSKVKNSVSLFANAIEQAVNEI